MVEGRVCIVRSVLEVGEDTWEFRKPNGLESGIDTGDGVVDVSMVWEDIYQTEDTALTVDGETVSYSGSMDDGQTHSEAIDLSTGSHDVDVSLSAYEAGVEIEWTEIWKTEDRSVTIDGETASHTGTLEQGGNRLGVDRARAGRADCLGRHHTPS